MCKLENEKMSSIANSPVSKVPATTETSNKTVYANIAWIVSFPILAYWFYSSQPPKTVLSSLIWDSSPWFILGYSACWLVYHFITLMLEVQEDEIRTDTTYTQARLDLLRSVICATNFSLGVGRGLWTTLVKFLFKDIHLKPLLGPNTEGAAAAYTLAFLAGVLVLLVYLVCASFIWATPFSDAAKVDYIQEKSEMDSKRFGV